MELGGAGAVGADVIDRSPDGGLQIKVIDGAQSVLGVRFGEASKDLPSPVETMARGEAQAELVAGYLRGLKCGGAVAATAWRAKNSAASV